LDWLLLPGVFHFTRSLFWLLNQPKKLGKRVIKRLWLKSKQETQFEIRSLDKSMKYIIFGHRLGQSGAQYMPVIFPEHVSHSQLLLEESEPVSAGFVEFEGTKVVSVYGTAGSMKDLAPHSRDKYLLEQTMKEATLCAFLANENPNLD
jgi:hypothetical protein